MKCFIFLFAFVVICQSLQLGGKSISFNDDGSIIIQGVNGRRVVIGREVGLGGQRSIEFDVSGPNFGTRSIQIYDQPAVQYEVLEDILRQYQGVVEEVSYQGLLQKIYIAVQRGQLSEVIYEIFQYLDQSQVIDTRLIDYLYRTGVIPQTYQGESIEGRVYPWGIPLSRSVGIQEGIVGQGLGEEVLDRFLYGYPQVSQYLVGGRSQVYPSVWDRLAIRQVSVGQRYGGLEGVYPSGRVGLKQVQLGQGTGIVGGLLGRQPYLQQRGILGQIVGQGVGGLQSGIERQPVSRDVLLNRVYPYGYNSIEGGLGQQQLGLRTRGGYYGDYTEDPVLTRRVSLGGRYNNVL